MINVIIPMAGEGRRFADAGYMEPKPLIPVLGTPMFRAAINNFRFCRRPTRFHFVTNGLTTPRAAIDAAMDGSGFEWTVTELTETTKGPACTALCAEVDQNEPLIIANCDQIIADLDGRSFRRFIEVNEPDGVLGCFISTSPKNSYVRLNHEGEVVEAREKQVISQLATNGFHYWRKAKLFTESAREMIGAGDTVNGEYYIAPTYNYLMFDANGNTKGRKVLPYFFNLHYPIGTPEDLQRYQQLYGAV